MLCVYHPDFLSVPLFLCACVCLCTDERFPEYGKVEFVFSFGPEKIKGVLRLNEGQMTKNALFGGGFT